MKNYCNTFIRIRIIYGTTSIPSHICLSNSIPPKKFLLIYCDLVARVGITENKLVRQLAFLRYGQRKLSRNIHTVRGFTLYYRLILAFFPTSSPLGSALLAAAPFPELM